MDIKNLRVIDDSLKNNDNFVEYQESDYVYKEQINFLGLFLIMLSIVIFFIVAACITENAFLCMFLVVLIIIICLACYMKKQEDLKLELVKLEQNLKTHNKNYYLKTFVEKVLNNLGNISKDVTIHDFDNGCYKLIINDETKQIHFVQLSWDLTKQNVNELIRSYNYSDILKYEITDNSTSEQFATSVTDSNIDNALLGAAVSKVLVKDPTVGAIIGSNAKRVTNTTFTTVKTLNYQIDIFLNKLDNSIISIETPFKPVINNIVSALEFIINNKV